MTDSRHPPKQKRPWKLALGLTLLVALVVAGVILWPVLFPPYAGDPIVGRWHQPDAPHWVTVFTEQGNVKFEIDPSELGNSDFDLERSGTFQPLDGNRYQVNMRIVGNEKDIGRWEYPLSLIGLGEEPQKVNIAYVEDYELIDGKLRFINVAMEGKEVVPKFIYLIRAADGNQQE